MNNNLKLVSIALFLSIIFNWFFLFKDVGLSFPIFTLVVVFSIFFLALIFKERLNHEAYFFAGIIVVLLLFIAIRDTEILKVINILAVVLLFVYLIPSSLRSSFFRWDIKDYIIKPFGVIFASLIKLVTLLTDPSFKIFNKSNATSQIIKGVLFALPALILFILLFASADLVFADFVK